MNQGNWKQHSKLYEKILRPLYIEEGKKLSQSYKYDYLIRDFKFSHDDTLIALISQPDNYEQKLYILTPDGKQIFSGSIEYEYDIWEGRNKPRTHMRKVKVLIKRIQWSPDNKFIWCATNEGIYEFSIHNQTFRRLFYEQPDEDSLKTSSFTDIAINFEKNILAVLGFDHREVKQGSIYFISFNGTLINKIDNTQYPEPYYNYDRVHYSYDFTKIFTIGDDKKLRIWNVESKEMLDEYELDINNPCDIYRTAERDQIFIGYYLIKIDNQGKIIDVQDVNKHIYKENKYTKSYYDLLDDNGNIFSTGKNSTGFVYNFKGNETGLIESSLKIYTANNKNLLALILDRSIVFYTSKDSEKQFYQINEERLASNAHMIVFSHDNKMIAVFGKGVYIGTIDGKALYEGILREVFEKEYWNLAPSSAYQKEGKIYNAIWSPDDKSLWCATSLGLYLFSVEDKDFIAIYPGYQLYSIAANPKKGYIAVAGQVGTQSEKKILMIDYNGDIIHEIVSHHTEGYIEYLGFSHDYTKIIITCSKGYMRILNENDGNLLDQTSQRIKELYLAFDENQFIIQSGGSWHLMTLNVEGKIDSIQPIKNNQLKYYIPNKIANFVQHNYSYKFGRDNFTVVGTNADIFAEVTPSSSGVDVPIRFFSNKPRDVFIEKVKPLSKGWIKEKTIPHVRRNCQLLIRLNQFPNKWVAVHWHEICLYDDELNEVTRYDFKNPQDSSSINYVVGPCDYNSKTCKLVAFVYCSSMSIRELHIIDFKEIQEFNSLKAKNYKHRPTTSDDFRGLQPVMLKWSPDGSKIAAIDDNAHSLIIYDENLEEIFRETFDLRHGPRNIEWAPSGDIIAVGFYEGIVYLYNIVTRQIERILPTVDIEDINKMVWNPETEELIIPSTRYINIFNKEGYIIRKLDIKEKLQFNKTTCKPGSNEFALYAKGEKDHSVYIIDRNNPIRECVIQVLPYLTDTIEYMKYESPEILFIQSSIGLTVWRKII